MAFPTKLKNPFSISSLSLHFESRIICTVTPLQRLLHDSSSSTDLVLCCVGGGSTRVDDGLFDGEEVSYPPFASAAVSVSVFVSSPSVDCAIVLFVLTCHYLGY